MNTLTVNDLYSAQSYRSQIIISEKLENKDFTVYVSYFEDDGVMIPMIVDGHHSLFAALEAGVEPEIVVVETEGYKNLEEYVIAFMDLSNPEKIDGTSLW